MKKRTKIIILSVMVLLLGVTGYLNIMLNNSINDETIPTQTTSSYFASYRQDRESSRERTMSYYNAIIDSTGSTEEESAKARESMLNLATQIEQELVCEGLIKGLGFEDCIMTITPSNFNVIIKSLQLQENEVAQIVSILDQQLSASIDNIKIIPVA